MANPSLASRIHNRLGCILIELDEFDAAVSHLERAVALLPDDPSAWRNLGSALLRANRLEEAAEAYQEALAREPNHTVTLQSLASTLVRLKRSEEALGVFSKLLTLDPDNHFARTSKGRILQNLGFQSILERQYAQGLNYLKEGVATSPENQEIRDCLARALGTCPEDSLREGTIALRLAEQNCAETGRKNPVFLDTLAIAQANAGRYQEAARISLEALDLCRTLNKPRLAQSIRMRIELYRSHRPYRNFP
jgi:tetratricopeptide (TPR) repeat protein